MKPIPQTATDKALAERARLTRNYRAAKKQQYATLFADPMHGERLRKFAATLGHFGIDDAEHMLAYISHEERSWLHNAPDDIRHTALEMIGNRIVRIRQKAGLCEFDDSLPGEPDDTFQLCKRELGL